MNKENNYELYIPENAESVTALSEEEYLSTKDVYDPSVSIGSEHRSRVKKIHIPQNIRIIENGIFADFHELTEIVVDDDNTYYKSVDGILYNKQLTKLICCPCAYEGRIMFPETVSRIASYAFSRCRFIDEITIPDNVKIIGGYAFQYSSVTEITLPKDLQNINEGMFVLCGKLKSVSIPNRVRTIRTEAFFDCKSLSEIKLPDSLEEIDKHAFRGCLGIKKLNIPANVKNIGDSAFKDMVDLTEVTVSEKSRHFGIKDGILYNKDSAEQIFALDTEAYTVSQDGMFKIKDGALVRYLGNENEVIIPPYIHKICSDAFFGKDMRKVVVPDTVCEIESDAFRSCGNLEEVQLPSKIDFLGEFAFNRCGNIKKLVLPEGTERFCFSSCAKLERLYLPSTFSQENLDAVQVSRRIHGSHPIKISVSPENKYYCSENGFLFDRDKSRLIAYMGDEENITVSEGVEVIGHHAFQTLNIRQITLPDSVRVIERSAFFSCKKLEEIDMRSVEEIGGFAFACCDALKKVTLSQNLAEIPEYAFSNCSSLESVIIPDGVESIGESAFSGCEHLDTVYIPDSVYDIQEDAFKDCQDVVLVCSIASCARDNKEGIECITE